MTPGHTHGPHGHAHSPAERLAGLEVARRHHRRLMERPTTFWGKLKQFVWGFLFFEWYHELQHERARYADVMHLLLFGELIGIPLMSSTIGLRLLPYALPELPAWKHRQLEEFDLVEHGPHIH